MIVILVALMLPILFVCWEYVQMKRAAQQLLELKDDYRSYAMTLKRLIREQAREKSYESLGQDSKKKSEQLDFLAATEQLYKTCNDVISSDDIRDTFLVVNRDPHYLRSRALDFARRYKLDSLLVHIYDHDSWQKSEVITQKIGYKKRKRRKKRITTIENVPQQLIFETEQLVEKSDFLVSWPIEKGQYWISHGYGMRKLRGKPWKLHAGIDMAAVRGVPVQAAAGGIVIQSGWNGGFGNCITIVHNRKYKTRYAHLRSLRVSVGQKIKRGMVIGTVGNTGHALGRNGYHLHFEVHSFGRPINPISVLV